MLTHADYAREQKIADAAVNSTIDHALEALGDLASTGIAIESALRIAMQIIDESMSYRAVEGAWQCEAIHDGLVEMARTIHERAEWRREDMESDEVFSHAGLDDTVARWAESPGWDKIRQGVKHPGFTRSVTDLSRDPD